MIFVFFRAIYMKERKGKEKKKKFPGFGDAVLFRVDVGCACGISLFDFVLGSESGLVGVVIVLFRTTPLSGDASLEFRLTLSQEIDSCCTCFPAVLLR